MQADQVDRRAPLLGLCLLLFTLVVLCSGLPSKEPANVQEAHSSGWRALFDYNRYKQLFQKHENSELETTTRRIYFMQNAIRAFVSGVAYKFGKSNWYEALNERSDWSPREIAQSENKAMYRHDSDPVESNQSDVDVDGQPDSSASSDLSQVASKLEAEIEQAIEVTNLEHALDSENRHDEDAGSDQSRASRRLRREKREASRGSKRRRKRKTRQMSIDMLVHAGGHKPEPANVRAKIDPNPVSNNPNHDRSNFELLTMGLIDQQEKIQLWKLRDPVVPASSKPYQAEHEQETSPSLLAKLKSITWKLVDSFGDFEEEDDDGDDEVEEDTMFVDLRQSGCMFQPSDQGSCGSCYAFAGITIAEWLFCNATGKLVKFSEQYLIDCGKGHIERMNGCSGAIDRTPPEFIHNFGLELAKYYPYMNREQQCPYDDDLDIAKTGFIRMPINNYVMVPAWSWPEKLEVAPLYIGLAAWKGFHQFGGGVYDGECGKKFNHAMVIVGHGRENGKEFWLIRNSHGTNWGEGGYLKLAKSATERCIENQMGYIYASKNSDNINVQPTGNGQNHRVQKVLEPAGSNPQAQGQRLMSFLSD